MNYKHHLKAPSYITPSDSIVNSIARRKKPAMNFNHHLEHLQSLQGMKVRVNCSLYCHLIRDCCWCSKVVNQVEGAAGGRGRRSKRGGAQGTAGRSLEEEGGVGGGRLDISDAFNYLWNVHLKERPSTEQNARNRRRHAATSSSSSSSSSTSFSSQMSAAWTSTRVIKNNPNKNALP